MSAARPTLLLAGFDAAQAAHLAQRLAGAGALEVAGDAAGVLARLARAPVDVLCLGAGLSGEPARVLLDAVDAQAPGHSGWSIVLCGGDEPERFQALVDADRIYWLARSAPPLDAIEALLRETLARRHACGPRATVAPQPQPEARLGLLARRLALAESEAERVARVEEAACEAVRAERAFLLRHDAEHDVFVAGAGDARRPSAAVGLAAFALRSGCELSVERAGDDPRYERDADDPGGDGRERLAAVPLRAPAAPVSAVLLALRAGDAAAFTDADLDALRRIALTAAAFLEPHAPPRAPAAGRRGSLPFRAEALAFHAAADNVVSEPVRQATASPRGLLAALRTLASERREFSAPWPRRRARRLRFVAQMTPVECGCACLAMVLDYHGKRVRLDEIRALAGVSREATNAQVLLEIGRRFGLRGRGVSVPSLEALRRLEPGTVLHWRLAHFVVLERLARDGAFVLDPGAGRRFVPLSELDGAFTGVALVFEPAEDFVPGGGPRRKGPRRVLDLLRPHAAAVTRLLVASLAVQFLALGVPLVTGLVVDRVVPQRDRTLLLVLALGVAALGAFQLVATLGRALLLLRLRQRLDARLANTFVEHLLELPWLYFNQRSRGDLLMRLNSHTSIRELLTAGTLGALLDALTVAAYLALLLAAHPRFGMLALALGALRVGLFVLTRRRYEELTARSLEAQAGANGYQVEILSGIETLKAAGAEPRAIERWAQLFAHQLDAELEHGRLDATSRTLLELLATLSPLVLLLYGAGLVLGGGLSLGAMLALGALAAGFLGPLSALVGSAYQWQLAAGYLERVDDVLDTPREPSGARAPGRLRGGLELREVTFRYGRLAAPAVNAVSLHVAPGRFVAVVGRSGSGKSTLAALFAGLLRPESGRVLYDGADLDELDLRALRRQLGFVAQQPYLFAQTIRANITLGRPDVPLARVVAAARLAALHDEIDALPLGYDTVLADMGASLSGGQRQRLALARALLDEPRVLVLDEATSALDGVTERRVFDSLAALEATRLVIAHRLSTVREADQILVMDAGRLVATGTHDELLVRSAVYRELAEAQEGRDRAVV